MGRYLLDTNVVIRMLMGDLDRLSTEVFNIVFPSYENQLYISTISLMELIHLHKSRKIDNGKKRKFKNVDDIVYTIEHELGIIIKPFAKEHALVMGKLVPVANHNDPTDHAIISHAKTEKLVLISSDTKFEYYITQDLKFLFNKRP